MNGRIHRSEVRLLDSKGRIEFTHKADLVDAKERKKLAAVLARRMELKVTTVEKKIETGYHDALNRRRDEEIAAAAATDEPPEGIYLLQSGQVCRRRPTGDAEVIEPLCNFNATIIEEIEVDDGAEVRRVLGVEGELADGTPLPRVDVTAADFAAMNWTLSAWGTHAVVTAGLGTKDHLRAALQTLSGQVPRRTIYGHSGWRHIGQDWVYLHAGGAIGPFGPVLHTVETRLPDVLGPMVLPDPPEGADLVRAVRTSLRMIDLGPHRITVPVQGGIYLAPLSVEDVSVYLAGPSGVFKTELAALAEQYYGAGFDSRHLPANWSSTANAIEYLAFVAKDMLLVADDFAPGGSTADVARSHREADRVFRGAGNRSARQRMRADGSLRPQKPPRCLTLGTGEEVPRGHSVRARLVIVEVSKGDIPPDRLSACQADAAAGLYASAMAAYLRWLAPRYETLRVDVRRELQQLRDESGARDGHRRTPANLAQLSIGWRYFLRFAEEAGVITPDEGARMRVHVATALRQLENAQAAHLQDAEPAAQFLRFLRACIASGRAHVANLKGLEPHPANNGSANACTWGWRQVEVGDHTVWQPQGKRVGWLDEEHLYLEPDAAHAEVQRFATEKGESFAITSCTLGKRLHEKGILVATDQARDRLTVRRTVEGRRDEVWCLSAGAFYPSPESAQSAQLADGSTQPISESNDMSNGVWAENSVDRGTGPTESAQFSEGNGPLGLLGRFSAPEETGPHVENLEADPC
jgi:hypothetical protein